MREPRKQTMCVPKYLQAKYRQLSAEGNNNTNVNTNQMYTAMLRATKSSISVIRCRNRCDTLRSLKKEVVGTSEVEELTKKLCVNRENKNFKNGVMDKVKKIVMREKLNDTYAEYLHSIHEDNETWRQSKKAITGARYTRKVKEDGQKKVDWLISKWRKKKEVVPDMYKGVHMKIDDGVFPPEFMNEPRLYGGVDVDESEKRALMLPPKFGLLEEVNVTKCRVQLEEALNKLRWNGIYGSAEQIGDMNMYDIGTRSMDINNLKVTSLPFNPGVRMPGPLRHEEEVRIHRFKDDVMKVARQMKSKGVGEFERGGEDRAGEFEEYGASREGGMLCDG